MPTVEIQVDDSKYVSSMNGLSRLLERSPKRCLQRFDRFLGFRNARSKLVSIHSKCVLTGSTSECWVFIEPSNLLFKVVSAMRTGNV